MRAVIVVRRQWEVFLEMLDANKTIEIMENDGVAAIVAHLKHYKLPLTKDILIKIAFENIAIFTGMCSNFRQYVDDQGYRHLILDHEYNMKWSRIASKVLSDLISVTLHIPTEVSILPNTFEIKIMEREI